MLRRSSCFRETSYICSTEGPRAALKWFNHQNRVFCLLLNSLLNLKFFIVKQQKLKPLIFREGCCSYYVVLIILNYINFKCFKGELRPCHIYVCGFKGGRLWDERWTFMG